MVGANRRHSGHPVIGLDVDAPKLIYLARRRPGTSRDEFVRRWRRHGALGMSMDFWSNTLRYMHCDIRAEVEGRGSIRDSTFDGFGMLWDRPGPRRSFPSDAVARAVMLSDELVTFSEPVALSQLRAVEHMVTPDADAIAVKLVRLIKFHDSLDTDARRFVWEDHSRSLQIVHGPIVRHVFNTVVVPPREESPLECDAVDEIGFVSLHSMLREVALDDLTVLHDREGRAVATARVFVTNEVVLYDAGQLAPLASP
jgi:hypothetical protein